MKEGDIVAVVNMAGEYVGRLGEQTDQYLDITSPRMVVNGPEGMGFAHGVCVTGQHEPESVRFFTAGVVFITPVNDEIEKAYVTATSGIIL